jgi:hypothetical protein
VCSSPPGTPPLYIVGRGAPLPLHQGTRRRQPTRGARTAEARAGAGRPLETLTLAGLGQG